MNRKKVLLASLIAVAILASLSVVSAGLFDGLFGEPQKDHVVEIENITFNTTNVTDFELVNESAGHKWFGDINKTGYNIHIVDFDEFEGILTTPETENAPSQTVNGLVVYTKSANTGEHVGEPRYVAYIVNKDLSGKQLYGLLILMKPPKWHYL